MNNCCKETVQELQNKLARISETLIKISGNRTTVMEEAAFVRAKYIIDIMETIKEFSKDKE